MKALDIIEAEPQRLERLRRNTAWFRREMSERGFEVVEGQHPIVPIVLGDEKKTVGMARELNNRGLFVVGFTYPVVPLGAARIRVQVSAAHTPQDLETAVNLFEEIGVKVGLLT